MQERSSLFVVSFLEYTMLYANFINRRYTTEVWAYGDLRYLDKNQHMVIEYDISFLFVYFEELWNKLLAMRMMYVGKVSAKEVTAFMLQTLPDFYSYMIKIARFGIVDCINENSFTEIVKSEVFRVTVGDYMVKTVTILKLNKNRDADKLANWFSGRPYSDYIFGDYSSLDFSEKVFAYMDFRFAQFRNSYMNATSLIGSSLIGANFRNAHMESCILDYCNICEADFSNAMLKNASFINVYARSGLLDEKKWRSANFLPTIFRNADLTGVKFSGADLTGADFSGAVLTDANFNEAIVDKAIFSEANIPLTDEQKNCVIIK